MSNNNFWGNLDSFSNFQQQSIENSQQNDEWSCSTDDWNHIEQSSTNKNSSTQKLNVNSDLTLHNYSVIDSNYGVDQSINSNRLSYNLNNGIENGQHKFSAISNNWFDKPEQISNIYINQNDNKKCDNIVETDDNSWADVENREILPPVPFQNDSMQVAMNNLHISDEVINYNVCDKNVTFNNTEIIKRNIVENDDDRPPVGLHRLVTGQTKSFEDNSNHEPGGPQPLDVRTVPGQLSDDDIPVQRHVTGSQIGTRSIDNNSNFQSFENNPVTLKGLPSLEQFQTQFEGHSRQVLHRDVEEFVNHPNDNLKLDDSSRIISEIDSYNTSIRNESQPELKEPPTVIKRNRPKILDHEVFERTGPDGYMNETSPYLRSTTQNQIKPVIDSPQDSLKLSTSTQSESIEKFQDYDRADKQVEKKHPPLPPGFHRMVEGNIGEKLIQKSRVPKINQKHDERQRRHSIDSDSSVPLTNPASEEGHKSNRRGSHTKKYVKNVERFHNRDRRHYNYPRESEGVYFHEEEEDNASLSPEVEHDYRSHRSRNQSRRFRHRNHHESYDHSDIEYLSEYDEFDEYERRRQYRSPESDRYIRQPRNFRDRRYQDDISQNFRREEGFHRNRPPSITDSDYHRRYYSPVPFQDYSAHIEKLDPLERRNFLLQFRENNPKAYTEWYTNYKAKVEMQKLIRTKIGSRISSPDSIKSDMTSLSHRQEKEKEIHRTTPLRYQKYHTNAKMNMGFGKLFVLDSSNAAIDVYKAVPELNDSDTAELFRFPTPFVLGKTHKNAVATYLNKLVEEASSYSERLLYELICMITKRNGIIDGTDISELLMENIAKFPIEDVSVDSKNAKDVKGKSIEPLNNFRELLTQGNKFEALEFAISNQDWGLAFILALYMDLNTLNYVKSKYFQTISPNDTLQTFFQLSSGKIPSFSTCCSDTSWGDWRKHLAMILSNQNVNINNARIATIQLGDTLSAKGDVFGAHFCYLAIQIPLDSIELSSKYTLLGVSSNQHFNTMATNRAILLTSAYEFAMRLNLSHFQISSLLPYKYLLAIRLAEYGECEHALHHLEAIATQVISSPPGFINWGFVANIVELSTDLHFMQISNNLPGNIETLDWLENLKQILMNTRNNSVDDVSQIQQIDNYQSHPILPSVVPNEHQIVSDTSNNYSTDPQTSQIPLQVVQQPPSTQNSFMPNVQQPNEIQPQTSQNEYQPYFVPPPMDTVEDITIHNNQNEMTTEISTITQNLPEISTGPTFGYFKQQMDELEQKASTGSSENKSPVKKDVDSKRQQQKEKNSWLGGLSKLWKPSNNVESLNENILNEETAPQAPPMDSELKFNPVANSSPANPNNQINTQVKNQRKRGKDMYVNVMSCSKPAENILTLDSIPRTNHTSTNFYNPSQG